MKKLNKQQERAKEAQISELIGTALNYFPAYKLLELLDEQVKEDEREDLITTCKNIILLCSGEYIATPSNISSERDLKVFCRANDIKLTDYMNNN